MVEMINKLTGTRMLVAKDRLEEYLAEGHSLAEEDSPEMSGHEEKSPETSSHEEEPLEEAVPEVVAEDEHKPVPRKKTQVKK